MAHRGIILSLIPCTKAVRIPTMRLDSSTRSRHMNRPTQDEMDATRGAMDAAEQTQIRMLREHISGARTYSLDEREKATRHWLELRQAYFRLSTLCMPSGYGAMLV